MNAEPDDKQALDSFVEAFKENAAGCQDTCECKRIFYNPSGEWDWMDGEVEQLERSKATNIDWAVQLFVLEGRRYVIDCDCWKPRVRQVIQFLRGHDEQIAKFLSAEKRRKQREAERSPVVE